MASMSRRAVLATLGAGGVALALGYVIRGFGQPAPPIEFADGGGDDGMLGSGMMGSGMMGNVGPADMRLYMDMFNRHNEISQRGRGDARRGPHDHAIQFTRVWPHNSRPMCRACTPVSIRTPRSPA